MSNSQEASAPISRASGDSVVATPASSSSSDPQRGSAIPFTALREFGADGNMDEKETERASGPAERQEAEEPPTVKTEQEKQQEEATKSTSPKKKTKCRKPEHKNRKFKEKKDAKASRKDENSSTEESEDESSTSSSSEDERVRLKKKKSRKTKLTKSKKARKAAKRDEESDSDGSDTEDSDASSTESSVCDARRKRTSKKTKHIKKLKKARKAAAKAAIDSDSEDSDTESDSSSQIEVPRRKKKHSKKSKRVVDSDSEISAPGKLNDSSDDDMHAQLAEMKRKLNAQKLKSKARRRSGKPKRKSSRKSDSLQYKRVDELWDSTIHNYKLKESAEGDDSEFAEFAFLVRRTFDWENKYRDTVVDIKSKQLRAALSDVMKDCKSVSLEAEEPTIDPNILFLYLEKLRTHYKKTLKTKIKAEKKRSAIKKLEQQRALLKTLVGYIDEDYAETKKTLYPLLESGNITFALLWALFHPNDIAVTSSYGAWSEPRCFKVDYANKCQSMARGEWYCVEGRYLEYDGKGFGFGDFEVDIDGFKGPRKITSLAAYPLRYHKEPEVVKKQIIERSRRFVEMEGMHYKFHKGLAFVKKKKQVLKININGRIMVDPATFRRINPNYPISFIKPKEDEDLFSDSDDDRGSDDDCSCAKNSDDENAVGGTVGLKNEDGETHSPKIKYKWVAGKDGRETLMCVEVDEDGLPIQPRKMEQMGEESELAKRTFGEEELLLASPVVLGFAFSEKMWLEFTISGVHEITYNENAFDSLVLPPNQKSIVRALVESNKFSAAKTIDDVVQGKGKGLVAVLHGPPGTGKTLTAEGIAELLKCPLYMVSAGELGTEPARLEFELQKILDVAHSWGAILLLDEADVFLEKREVHDIHRNALVSIFLRLLEYFQGILFLTTNRVETFDDAFQSRIHVALRYGELTAKAKKTVWKMFVDRVRQVEGMEVDNISDYDFEVLSRNQLNGRQIKNLVRTAQALAINEKRSLSLEHIKRVIDVAETFDRDLKGGTGYIDAMRSYT